jgi:hypothetical protein
MIELKHKWHCQECGHTCVEGEPLRAFNPFDDDHYISGCPTCFAVESLVGACQHEDCSRPSSSGTPNVDGYRYVSACTDHLPMTGKWVSADPDLIKAESVL